MKISIITATYNSAKTIKTNIDSINEQSFKNIEHIIIDGASVDDTLEIIRAKSRKNLIIRSEPDKGIYDALNKGISLASGDIIGFLHSDDCFYSPKTLEDIANKFIDNISFPADVVYGDLVFTDKNNPNKLVRYWKSNPFKPGLLEKGWMPPHPTLFMKREVYEKHGLFNIGLKCAADYDYILRVFNDESLHFKYLPETITKMKMGGVSTTGFWRIINKKKEDYLVLKDNNIPNPLKVLILKNILKIQQLLIKKS
jgi:Glycosyltransferases involved in cell wall biogenesis